MLDDFMLLTMFCCVGAFGVLLLLVHYWKLRCKCKHQDYLLDQGKQEYQSLQGELFCLQQRYEIPTRCNSMTNLREFFSEQQKKHPLK